MITIKNILWLFSFALQGGILVYFVHEHNLLCSLFAGAVLLIHVLNIPNKPD